MEPVDATVRNAAAFVESRLDGPPRIGLILGSGLGSIADAIEEGARIRYTEIPGFPGGNVAGHTGTLVAGAFGGTNVIALQGRFHLYEGFDPATVVLPTRMLVRLGIRILLVTNAAGGLDVRFRAGDLMIIDDHINLMGANPLTGPVQPGEIRFPDMSAPYDAELQSILETAAIEERIDIRRGVYVALAGPSYETPAEIRMLQRLGAHAVGMSTAPEVIAARAAGVRVAGISIITNAAGPAAAVSHEEVLDAGRSASTSLLRLLQRAVPRMSEL
jgi:purine-nucleoside phosphorylase